MNTYSVPGEWFDDVAGGDMWPENDDPDYYDPDAPRLPVEPVLTDPLSNAILTLRWLSKQLSAEGSALAHVPAEIANSLVGVRAPDPAPRAGTAAPSPTGNCRQCGAALPLTATGRGRPRTLCLVCSPSKTNIPGKNTK